MKTKLTNWKFWVLLLTLNFGVKAQDTITTTLASISPGCDGTATINTSIINTSWAWYTFTGTELQIGGATIDSLCPGTYRMKYYDVALTNTVDVLFTISTTNNPCTNATIGGTITSTNSTSQASCDGTLTATITGAANYTLQWGNNAGTSANLTNLCPGNYTLVATDNNSCSVTLTGIVGVDSTNTGNPCSGTTLTGTVSTTNVTNPNSCDGTITTLATGGIMPYSYSLDNGATYVTSNIMTNLCSNTYIIQVQDSLGCMIMLTGIVGNDSTNVTFPCTNTNMFAQVVTTGISTSANCDGSISATVTGGTSPYVYTWNNGQNTASLNNLCSDVYTVVIADANGCIVTATGFVAPVFDSTVVMNLNGYVIPTGETADGACNGNASVIVYGGTAPYTYLFSNNSTNSTTSGLCAGLQSVVVTDNNGATLSLDFIISSPANITTTTTYSDSTIIDSVYTTAATNCTINYSVVDSAFIANYTILPNDSLIVTWNVVFNGDSTVSITNTYGMGFGATSGVYTVTLQIYCPNKSLGNFLTATDQVYYNAAYAGILENNLEDNNVAVYPNPFNDHIMVSIKEGQTADITIADISGKVVINKKISNQLTQIDMTSLSAGQYIVTITNGSGVTTRKIVK